MGRLYLGPIPETAGREVEGDHNISNDRGEHGETKHRRELLQRLGEEGGDGVCSRFLTAEKVEPNSLE